ncbi:hypothetical protein [Natronorubrum texcoconense]|uniref:Response regulatory domain-containing protein n=1 Tax=Natronorubrum texcoconense TaxID=1095776 RepID=A0A1G9BLT2_9EURY|nr:hypothetical protein [Natronorubrum texcoconense]SDK40353.1 hypothetical protein SAMN04515672_3009 [Natronorubrum texcoconense]
MSGSTRVTVVAEESRGQQLLAEITQSEVQLTVEEIVPPSAIEQHDFSGTCCVITIDDEIDMPTQEIYDHFRSTHPNQPAILISSNAEAKLIETLLEDPNGEYVFLSDEGASMGLASVRCKKLLGEM